MGNNFDIAQFAQAMAQFANMMQTQQTQTAQVETKKVSQVQTQEKRGRGRPKKVQTQVAQTAPIIASEKRGRGRPKKVQGAVITNVTVHRVKDNKVLTSAEIEREKMNAVVNNAQANAQAKIEQSAQMKNGKITKVLFTACVKKEYKDKLRNMKVIALGNAYFPYDARRQMIGAPISEKTMAHYYKLRHNSEIEIDAKFARILVVE